MDQSEPAMIDVRANFRNLRLAVRATPATAMVAVRQYFAPFVLLYGWAAKGATYVAELPEKTRDFASEYLRPEWTSAPALKVAGALVASVICVYATLTAGKSELMAGPTSQFSVINMSALVPGVFVFGWWIVTELLERLRKRK
jgi:hypothetical protein